MGLELAENHRAKFDSDQSFICLEKKGIEAYPSKDKAVLFFEVPDLKAAVNVLGREKIMRAEKT